MTIVAITTAPIGPVKSLFIADVTFDGSESFPQVVPHGMNTTPLMFWLTFLTGTFPSDASQVPQPYLLSADATDISITVADTHGATGFAVGTIRLYVMRPHSIIE